MTTTSFGQTTIENKTTKRTTVSKRGTGKPESELRATARRHSLTMQELAAQMGISGRYLSMISTGKVPWSQPMKEKVKAVLGLTRTRFGVGGRRRDCRRGARVAR